MLIRVAFRIGVSVLVMLGLVFILIGLYIVVAFCNWRGDTIEEMIGPVPATPTPLNQATVEQLERQREREQNRAWASASRAPQWFPDGDRIAFGRGGRLYVSDSAGTRLDLIDGSGEGLDLVAAPSISPDGSRIAYAVYFEEPGTGSESWEIVTAKPDGTDELRLTENDTLDMNPVWSPDGTHIAFAVSPQPNRQLGISVMEADGSESRPLVTPEDLESRSVIGPPAWSPDGGRIAILAGDPEGGKFTYVLYVVAVDGTGLRTLADNTSMPTWSPDGRSIAFAMTSTDGGLYSLYTIDPDGSQLNEVAESPFRTVHRITTVSWSPDGSAILFGEHVFPIDGSAEWTLPWTDERTAWSPDGPRIAGYGGYHDVWLYTVERDGSDGRVLVERDENGKLVAAGGKPLP